MRIAIDARMIAHNQMHGIARYVYHLILELSRIDQVNEYYIFISDNSPLTNTILPTSFKLITLKSKFISLREQFELPKVLKQIGAHLFHSPSFVAPLFCPCHLVMTLHDLNHLVLPQYYTLLHKLYYRFFVRRCIEKSIQILTVSEFSKKVIENAFKIHTDRIMVTYNGVADNYFPSFDSQTKALTLEKYDLHDDFIFYLGNNKPHKNVYNLIEAYCISKLDIPLVVCCPVDVKVIQLAAKYDKQYNLYFTKFITESDLPMILNSAKLFVYPSTYEGFGLPPLEAMACGTPVVISNTSSLPEVAGDAAIFVDPFNLEDMAKGLRQGITNHSLRKKLINKGIERSKKFSWKQMALSTLQVYHNGVKTA